jgi:hypothetical protein
MCMCVSVWVCVCSTTAQHNCEAMAEREREIERERERERDAHLDDESARNICAPFCAEMKILKKKVFTFIFEKVAFCGLEEGRCFNKFLFNFEAYFILVGKKTLLKKV